LVTLLTSRSFLFQAKVLGPQKGEPEGGAGRGSRPSVGFCQGPDPPRHAEGSRSPGRGTEMGAPTRAPFLLHGARRAPRSVCRAVAGATWLAVRSGCLTRVVVFYDAAWRLLCETAEYFYCFVAHVQCRRKKEKLTKIPPFFFCF